MADHNYLNVEKQIKSDIKQQFIHGFKDGVKDAVKEISKEKVTIMGDVINFDSSAIYENLSEQVEDAFKKIRNKKKLGNVNVFEMLNLNDKELRNSLENAINESMDFDSSNMPEELSNRIVALYTVAQDRALKQIQDKQKRMQGLSGLKLDKVKNEKTFNVDDILTENELRNFLPENFSIDSAIKMTNEIINNAGTRAAEMISSILESPAKIAEKMKKSVEDQIDMYDEMVDSLPESDIDKIDPEKTAELYRKMSKGILNASEAFELLQLSLSNAIPKDNKDVIKEAQKFLNDYNKTITEYHKQLKETNAYISEENELIEERSILLRNGLRVGGESVSSNKTGKVSIKSGDIEKYNADTVLHTHPLIKGLDNLRFSGGDIANILEEKVSNAILMCGEEILEMDLSMVEREDLPKLKEEILNGYTAIYASLGAEFEKMPNGGLKLINQKNLPKDIQNKATELINSFLIEILNKYDGTLSTGKISGNKIIDTTNERIKYISDEDIEIINEFQKAISSPNPLKSIKDLRDEYEKFNKTNLKTIYDENDALDTNLQKQKEINKQKNEELKKQEEINNKIEEANKTKENINKNVNFSSEKDQNSNIISIFKNGVKTDYDINTQKDELILALKDLASIMKNPQAHAGNLKYQTDPTALYRSDNFLKEMTRMTPGLISGMYLSSNFIDVLDFKRRNGDANDYESPNDRRLYALDVADYSNLLKFNSDSDFSDFTAMSSAMNLIIKNNLLNSNIDVNKEAEELYKKNQNWFELFNYSLKDFVDFLNSEIDYLKHLNLENIEDKLDEDYNLNVSAKDPLKSINSSTNRLLESMLGIPNIGIDLTDIVMASGVDSAASSVLPKLTQIINGVDFNQNEEVFLEFYKMIFEEIILSLSNFNTSQSFGDYKEFTTEEIANILLDKFGFNDIFNDDNYKQELIKKIIDKIDSSKLTDFETENSVLINVSKERKKYNSVYEQQLEYAQSEDAIEALRIPEVAEKIFQLVKDQNGEAGVSLDSNGKISYNSDIIKIIKELVLKEVVEYGKRALSGADLGKIAREANGTLLSEKSRDERIDRETREGKSSSSRKFEKEETTRFAEQEKLEQQIEKTNEAAARQSSLLSEDKNGLLSGTTALSQIEAQAEALEYKAEAQEHVNKTESEEPNKTSVSSDSTQDSKKNIQTEITLTQELYDKIITIQNLDRALFDDEGLREDKELLDELNESLFSLTEKDLKIISERFGVDFANNISNIVESLQEMKDALNDVKYIGDNDLTEFGDESNARMDSYRDYIDDTIHSDWEVIQSGAKDKQVLSTIYEIDEIIDEVGNDTRNLINIISELDLSKVKIQKEKLSDEEVRQLEKQAADALRAKKRAEREAAEKARESQRQANELQRLNNSESEIDEEENYFNLAQIINEARQEAKESSDELGVSISKDSELIEEQILEWERLATEESNFIEEQKEIKNSSEENINSLDLMFQAQVVTYAKAIEELKELKKQIDIINSVSLEQYRKKQEEYSNMSIEELEAKYQEKINDTTVASKKLKPDDLKKKWAGILALIEEIERRTGNKKDINVFNTLTGVDEIEEYAKPIKKISELGDNTDIVSLTKRFDELKNEIKDLSDTSASDLEKLEFQLISLFKVFSGRGSDDLIKAIRLLSSISKLKGVPRVNISDYEELTNLIYPDNKYDNAYKKITKSNLYSGMDATKKEPTKEEKAESDLLTLVKRLEKESEKLDKVNSKGVRTYDYAFAVIANSLKSSNRTIEDLTDNDKLINEFNKYLQEKANKKTTNVNKVKPNNIIPEEEIEQTAEQTAESIILEGNAAENASVQISNLNKIKILNAEANRDMAKTADVTSENVEEEGKSSKDASKNIEVLNSVKKDNADVNKEMADTAETTTESVKEEGVSAENAAESIDELTKSQSNNAKASDKNKEKVDKITEAYKTLSSTEKEFQKLNYESSNGLTKDQSGRLAELNQRRDEANKILKNQTKLTKEQIAAQKEYEATRKTVSAYMQGYTNTDTFVKDSKSSIKNLKNKKGDYSEEYYQRIREIEELVDKINSKKIDSMTPEELEDLEDAKQTVSELIDDLNNHGNGFKLITDLSRSKLNKQMTDWLTANTAASKESRMEVERLQEELKSIGTNDELKKISSEFLNIASASKLAGKNGASFFTMFKSRLKDMNAKFFARYFSLYDIIRYIRTAVSTVTELDTAMTELRKVSDATGERLQQSFTVSTNTAKELGSTITNVINATADWSRLGYNIGDAEELARVSTLYVNVGDNMTMDSANESLISTLQGFQMKAEDAESIVDKFNEVANNFAIDTAGIGQALQRSAASFNAAHTDLNEAIALVTTANAVAQNPESVGTTFKTLSARIRGAKTELEELGEEEDQYTKTTSTLRDLVKSLTGFDIMKDENTFKSIYEIILGIGKEWDKLTDTEQASLGEALAGKRNANVLYAVMQNTKELEEVYKTAQESAGSAMREQENYEKSIQYSVDKLKAVGQEVISNLINSDSVKEIIETASSSLEGLGKIAEAISPALSSLAQIISVLIKLLSSFNGIPAIFVSLFAILGGSTKYISSLSKETNTATKSLNLLNSAINKNIESMALFLLTDPIGWLIDIAAAIYLVVKAYDYFTISVKEAEEYLNKWNEKLSESKDKLISQKKLVEEVKNSYADLAKGVNRLTNENIDLPEEDYAKFITLNNQLAEQFPELITGIDNEGNYIINLGNNAEETAKKLDDLITRQERLHNIEISDNLSNTFKNSKKLLDDKNNQQAHYEKEIEDYEKNVERLTVTRDALRRKINLAYDGKATNKSDILWTDLDESSIDVINLIDGVYDKFLDTIDNIEKRNEYEALRNRTEYTYDANGNLNYAYSVAVSQLDPSDAIKLMQMYEDEYTTEINNYKNNIYNNATKIEDNQRSKNSYWESYVNDNLIPAMHSKYQYMNFSEEGQKIADALVSGISVETSEKMDEDDPFKYIQENILNLINELENYDLYSLTGEKLSIEDLFNGELSNDELINLYNQIQNFFKENGVEISFAIGEEAVKVDNEFEANNQDIAYKNGYSNSTSEYEQKKINEYTKDFSTEQKKAWTEVTKGCNSADEAIQMWEKHLKEVEETINNIKNKTANDFTPQNLSENVTSRLTGVQSLYQNFSDNVVNGSATKLDIEDVEGLRSALVETSDQIGITEADFEEFERIVSDGKHSAQEMQDAFDLLSTKFVDVALATEGCTEKNKDLIKSQLELAGYTEESVDKYVEYRAALLEANEAIASMEIETLSTSDLNPYFDELIEKGELAKDTIWNLYLSELAANNVDLNSEASITDMYNLAQSCQATGKVVDLVTQLMSLYSRMSAEIAGNNNPNVIAAMQSQANQLNTQIQSAMNAELDKKPIELKNINVNPKGAGGAGKEAADAYKEAFEKELKELDELRDAGVISEREYLERLKALYIKYFKDRKEYLKEFKQYEKQYLEGMKSLYESAISGAITILNDQINDLEKAKDEAVEALENARDAEIKPLEEKVKALEKERDEMQKVNEQRERELNLQKAKYDLERAMSQRNRLIYKNGQMQYVNDYAEVRDTKENLEQAIFDKKIGELDDQIDELNDQIDEINEKYDKLIEQTEKFYDEQIKGLQDMIDKWEEIQHVAEMAEAIQALSELGLTMDDVLSGNVDFEGIKTQYAAIIGGLNGIDSAAQAVGKSAGELNTTLGSILNYDFNTLNAQPLADSFSDIEDSAKNASKAIGGGGGGSTSGNTDVSSEDPKASGGGSENANGDDTLIGGTKTLVGMKPNVEDFASAFAGKGGSSGENKEGGSDLASQIKEAATQLGNSESKEDEKSLIGGIKALRIACDENMEPINTYFSDLAESLTTCASKITEFANAIKEFGEGGGIFQFFGIAGGTATSFTGTAYARGKWNAGSKGISGNSLVGELGQELVVHDNGTFETVGDNGAEFTNIKSSDIVFNHKQTEELLKNGKINSRGKAYASGKDNIFSPLSPTELSKYDLNLTKDLTEKLEFGNQKLTSIDKAIGTITNSNTVNNSGQTFNINNEFTCNGISLAEVQQELAKAFEGIFVSAYQRAMK